MSTTVTIGSEHFIIDDNGNTIHLSDCITEMRRDIDDLLDRSYPGLDVDLQNLIALDQEKQEKIEILKKEIEKLKTEIKQLRFDLTI